MEQEHALTPAAVPQRFDYGTIADDDDRRATRRDTEVIRQLCRRAAEHLVEIGKRLLAVKERLPHGEFGRWLASEFAWSHDTANNLMNVARRFPQIPNGSDFAPRALYLLAGPNVPGEAREEAVRRAEAGERIDHAAAKRIVADHRGEEGAVCGIPQTADHTPVVAPVEAEEEPPGLTPKQEYQRRYPHSTALVGWLNHVGGQTFHIEADLGGLGALLAEPGKWDRQETVNFILPQLDALGRVIATYRREIGHVFE